MDVFWFLIFLVFPLAYLPASLGSFGSELLSYPPDAYAEYLVPKILVLIVAWFLGVALVVHAYKHEANQRFDLSLRLLALFLISLLMTSLFNGASLNFDIAGLGSRAINVLAVFAEVMGYSMAAIAALIFRLYPSHKPMVFMVAGAALVSLWTLFAAYGMDPAIHFLGAEPLGNIAATLGHQGFVAAYLGVVLVFGLSWKVLSGQVRVADLVLGALLSAGLVASGGRAGMLAAFTLLLLMLLYSLWRQRSKATALRVIAVLTVLLLPSLAVTLTSSHAGQRVEALEAAAQGSDPAVNHRLIFWQLAARALWDRPLLGHGTGAFSKLAWDYASPRQADALIAEFVPPELAKTAVRLENRAIYLDPEENTFRFVFMRPFKVHNYFLDMALASGIVSTLLFAAFILVSANSLYQTKTPLALGAIFALFSYLLYGSVWFATINVDPIVWTVIGLGLAHLPVQQAVARQDTKRDASASLLSG